MKAIANALVTGCSVLLLLLPAVHADDSFEAWKREQLSGFKQSKDEFKAYRQELKAAFEEYKRKTAAVWGRDNIVPGKNNWVSYIDNLNHRSVVDFEKGIIDVELAVPDGLDIDDAQARKQLEQTLLKAISLGEDKRPMQQIARQPVSLPDGDAVLLGQISRDDGTVANADDYPALAHEAANNAEKRILRGNDGRTRIVYEAQLKLVPEHIRIRARKYQPLVNKYAKKHNVPAPVIFAVIETESMFNPLARSPAPAFGLMQLVPTSGARDAYRFLYNKDRIVSDTYLYNPENNIRLGSAYLLRLNSEYLKGIESDQSRMFATIAAYNTGPSNIFRAFVGSYSRVRFGSYANYRKAALREINRRSPEQVYQHLRRHLAHKEARNYIKTVTERTAKYTA